MKGGPSGWPPSAGGGSLYLVEGGGTLVARAEATGTVVWSESVKGAGAQSPVLANGLVFVGTNSGVATFDPATGTAGWTASLTGAAATLGSLSFTGDCAGAVPAYYTGSQYQSPRARTTTMAAALGSGTLVVAAQDGIHVLSLAGGAAQGGAFVPNGANGALRDPVIVGNRLYVMDQSGLIAIDSQ